MEIPETQEENTYEAEDFFDRDEFRDQALPRGEVSLNMLLSYQYLKSAEVYFVNLLQLMVYR